MRRLISLLSVAALTSGALIVAAAPAQGADLGTITVTGSGSPYSYSPITLSGAVGDTFTVVDSTSGGETLSVTFSVGAGDTGEISVGASICSPGTPICAITTGSQTYTIVKLGTISLTAQPSGPIGQITLQAAGGGSTDPQVVYPFMTLNPNGGTCSGTLEFNAIPGTGNDSVILPTSSTCTRSGYTLFGWAYNADGTGTVLLPGIVVATGSTTLFAVWRPNGVQVTYDANVGLSTQCLAGGANIATAAGRRSTSVVQAGSNSATTAPCTPVDGRLAGWANTGDGPVALQAGQSLPATLTSGSTVTLFAKWETVYGLSASSSSVKFRPGGSAVVTFTATVNGAPAPGREVALSTSGDPVSLSPGPSVGATTDAAGKVSVTIAKRSAGEATVTATFGDRSATVDVSAVDSATIDITGERGTVAGKSGIIVNGTTTGFTAGDTVVPYVRFPGQEYTQGSARPEIAADGSFEWERKTGKKTYVYFTSADGTLTSNRIIIAAQ